MLTDIPLRCACGELRGTALAASPTTGSRMICYCNDCQAFARFLGRPGVTDEHGGTDICSTGPFMPTMTWRRAGASRRPDGVPHWRYCSA